MKRLFLSLVVVMFINACDTQQSNSPKSAPAAAKETNETPMTGPMSFFVSSVSGGDGANYGGLEGADAHCQKLATEAGSGNKAWKAFF